MSQISLSSCLKVAFFNPKGSKSRIISPLLLAAIIIPLILLFYSYFFSVKDMTNHANMISQWNQLRFVLSQFLGSFIENLIFLPLTSGVILCALYAQRHKEANSLPLFGAFKAYRYWLSLLLFTFLLSVFATLGTLMRAVMGPFLQLNWIEMVGVTIVSLALIITVSMCYFAILFMIDAKQSCFDSIKNAFKQFFNIKTLLPYMLSIVIFLGYLFMTLIPGLLGEILMKTSITHETTIKIVALITISFVWLAYTLPGLFHLLAHPYAKAFPKPAHNKIF